MKRVFDGSLNWGEREEIDRVAAKKVRRN